VVLIGPETLHREAVAKTLAGSQAHITREFSSYPGLDDVPKLLDSNYDVAIVELDSDPEHALDLVENICVASSITVMIYSARSDAAMLVRCMRAGAREFMTLPITPAMMDEALVRAMVRRPGTRPEKKVDGKLFVFIGAKGGSGTTTVASNFAVSVAQETGEGALLIDLNLPIGDAALGLGVRAPFSTANALENARRLDANFLLKLLAKHTSGLSVLAAPDDYTSLEVTAEAVERLLTVARQNFSNVIVDAGSSFRPSDRILIDMATMVYLVTQVTISELRNSNRLITEFHKTYGRKPEVVLNRFSPGSLVIGEKEIEKALNQTPGWKIPGDYGAARRAQNTAHPLVMEDSPISRTIRQMARTACGLPADTGKKKIFSLFG
jgi:pilus assembly protein CpaE